MRYNVAVFTMALCAGCTVPSPDYMTQTHPARSDVSSWFAPDDLVTEPVDMLVVEQVDLARIPDDLTRPLDLIPVVGGEFCQKWGDAPEVSFCRFRCRWKRWEDPRVCNTCVQILPLLCHDGDFPNLTCVKACPLADGDICN